MKYALVTKEGYYVNVLGKTKEYTKEEILSLRDFIKAARLRVVLFPSAPHLPLVE